MRSDKSSSLENFLSRIVAIKTDQGVTIFREGGISDRLPVEGSREVKISNDAATDRKPAES